MKQLATKKISDAFKLKHALVKKNNKELNGNINFNISFDTFEDAKMIMSEEEILKVIGQRVIELICSGI